MPLTLGRNDVMPPTDSSKDAFPEGMRNVYLFTVFNALSYQIVLSSPMVLYAKSLDASATVLGILAGMMPMLVIFQIPAAKHVARVGYKKFILAGWGTRVLFIFGLMLVPMTGGFLDNPTRLALLLMLLFGFNLSRGISSCAWLPWIAAIIPGGVRGRYLLIDAACLNLTSFVVFVFVAFCLGVNPQPWQFGALFAFSAVMGAISLSFVRRIPEPATPEHVKSSNTPVPWKAIAAHPPFRKLMEMVVVWSVAYGGLNTFVVSFLKTESTLSERDIMLVTSVAFLGGLGSLWFMGGSRLDRFGSKPVITASLLGWLGIMCGWALLAGRILPLSLMMLLTLQFLMGLGFALVNMATTRLAMAVVPPMGRDHFFALYSVVGNLTLGLAPVGWGLIIDGLRSVNTNWHGLMLNRYTLFFAAVALVFMAAMVMCRRLKEPEAASMEELLKDILRQSPLRSWFRFGPRS